MSVTAGRISRAQNEHAKLGRLLTSLVFSTWLFACPSAEPITVNQNTFDASVGDLGSGMDHAPSDVPPGQDQAQHLDATSSADASVGDRGSGMDHAPSDVPPGQDQAQHLDATSSADAGVDRYVGVTPGVLLFEEDFEDDNFASRDWYDAPSGTLTPSEHIAGSSSAYACFFASGQTGCAGGTPGRHLFAPSNAVYLSYWVKYSDDYIGSGHNYHPHEFHFVTNQDSQWVGPACTHLTLYIEQIGGTARLAMQDSSNVDADCILRNDDQSIGCGGGSVADYNFTEARSAASCNGLVGDYDQRDCFSSCTSYYSAKGWGPGLETKTFGDDANAANYKGSWHHIETYFKLNSIQDGIGVADGQLRYWFDGETVISYDQVLFRTGAQPDMAFNQFIIAPYIGDGSPVDQTMWLDNLLVATGPLP